MTAPRLDTGADEATRKMSERTATGRPSHPVLRRRIVHATPAPVTAHAREDSASDAHAHIQSGSKHGAPFSQGYAGGAHRRHAGLWISFTVPCGKPRPQSRTGSDRCPGLNTHPGEACTEIQPVLTQPAEHKDVRANQAAEPGHGRCRNQGGRPPGNTRGAPWADGCQDRDSKHRQQDRRSLREPATRKRCVSRHCD